jgi:hypothetical protein
MLSVPKTMRAGGAGTTAGQGARRDARLRGGDAFDLNQ